MKLKDVHSTAVMVLRNLICDLVMGNYKALEADGRAGRLTSDELATAVNAYKHPLLEVPVQVLENVKAVAIQGTENLWVADIDLWTAQGQSDLTLSIAIQVHQDDVFVRIDDLHVL